jgi:Bacterial archaeo-eukaryotic release factor family 2
MRERGVTPAGGVDASDLRPAVDATGPFVTLLLDTDPTVENAGVIFERRWKTTRRDLADAGTHEAALAHIDERAPGAHLRGHAFYAVANDERLWVVGHWAQRPSSELMRWAPLPTLTPLIAERQTEIPHIVALVDREGGDLFSATPEATESESIEGQEGPVVHRSKPGGWSQMRYQHRAEDAWARTAKQIAEALVEQFDAIHGELVVMAGDVREVQLVTDDLPDRVRERVHVVSGGRAPGVDKAAMADAVARLVRTAAADHSVALLRKLRDEVGEHDRAVVGPHDTFDALSRAQVEVLLVHDDPSDDRIAWFGPNPLPVGLMPDAARIDSSDVHEGRLVDVAMRSALAGDARIRVIPSVGAVAGGIAGILRWTD